ncbi:hypothetical protein [Acinetobacter larvae]|nr:hypothetical protein [Acinetobacter larvae]
MKKTIIISAVMFSMGLCSTALYAESVKLSRSCIKKNPLVNGAADPTLLSIYAQICDKKNKEPQQQSIYLIQAAQRFTQLDQPYKALTIINTLEQRHIQHNVLTDVKFAASSALANQAILQMREHEARYLPSDQLTSTQNLLHNIQLAQGAPKETVVAKAVTVEHAAPATVPTKPQSRRRVTTPKAVTPNKVTPRTHVSQHDNNHKSTQRASGSSSDPFNGLK